MLEFGGSVCASAVLRCCVLCCVLLLLIEFLQMPDSLYPAGEATGE